MKELSLEGAPAASGCTRSNAATPGVSAAAECRRVTAADLAQALPVLAPGYFDRSVVNTTELNGVYDFTLEWISRPEAESGAGGPTIFDAVARLGLKLAPKKEPMDILVIDHAEKTPTGN